MPTRAGVVPINFDRLLENFIAMLSVNRFHGDEAGVAAIAAGHDVVVHSPDDRAVVAGLRQAVDEGRVDVDEVDASVRRILAAKAQLGLHERRRVDFDAVPNVVGTRSHLAVAAEVSRRGITLLVDAQEQVPLAVPRSGQVLYLSVLDYPSGWGNGAPSRTFLPELRARWPNVTAIEVSDRTTPAELELLDEGDEAVVMTQIGVTGDVGGFIRAAHAEVIHGNHAHAPLHEYRNHFAIEIRPRRLAMQQ